MVPLFIAFRPPNFSISMIPLAALLALLAGLLPRSLMLMLQIKRGRTTLWREISEAPMFMNMILLATTLVVSLLFIEAILHFYNPFLIRVRGDRIVLPVLTKEVIHNKLADKMEPVVVHSKNSIGLRGEDPPVNFKSRLSLIAVGGSTTEDAFISDESTWVAVMHRTLLPYFPDLWTNNAGFAGHSTVAHGQLINDYLAPLRPNVVLILAGINDLAKASLMPIANDVNNFEQKLLRENVHIRPFLDHLSDFSELANIANTLRRRYQAARAGLQPFLVDRSGKIPIPGFHDGTADELNDLRRHVAPDLQTYRQRLNDLIERIRSYGGLPILITQPLLWGDVVDPDTGLELARILEIINDRTTSSLVLWRLLEDYNDVMRAYGREFNVPVIDLAQATPKRSEFYYDKMHFSPAGAKAVGIIVATALCPILKTHFPKWSSQDCFH